MRLPTFGQQICSNETARRRCVYTSGIAVGRCYYLFPSDGEFHVFSPEITKVLLAFLNLERVKGIEPSSQAWEAHVLPLNHTRETLRIIGNMPPDARQGKGCSS